MSKWWKELSYEAARRALLRAGHATGWAGTDWSELPLDIRIDLAKVRKS